MPLWMVECEDQDPEVTREVCRALTAVKGNNDSECQQNGAALERHVSSVVHSITPPERMEGGELRHLVIWGFCSRINLQEINH